MINWTIKIARPILTEGMFFQVRYRKVDSQDWIPFSPNPTTNEFTITALEDDTNYEAEIRTICLNGELSRPVYYQLKEGDREDDDPVSPTPQPQPPTTPDIQIYWFHNQQLRVGDVEDKTGSATTIEVGSETRVMFEYKEPNSNEWITVDPDRQTGYYANIPIYQLGVTEIRGYIPNDEGDKNYSNILKYIKINPVSTPIIVMKKYTISGKRPMIYTYENERGETIRKQYLTPFGDVQFDEICAVAGTVKSLTTPVDVKEKGNC